MVRNTATNILYPRAEWSDYQRCHVPFIGRFGITIGSDCRRVSKREYHPWQRPRRYGMWTCAVLVPDKRGVGSAALVMCVPVICHLPSPRSIVKIYKNLCHFFRLLSVSLDWVTDCFVHRSHSVVHLFIFSLYSCQGWRSEGAQKVDTYAHWYRSEFALHPFHVNSIIRQSWSSTTSQ